MIVSAIVIKNEMEIQLPRSFTIDLAQKLQKLLIAMKRITGTDNGTFENIQRCKEAGGPVTFIIMRHRPTSSFFHRQPGLGSVQRLYLRLFIDTQHQRFIRRIKKDTNTILYFSTNPFVFDQLERFGSRGCHPHQTKTFKLS